MDKIKKWIPFLVIVILMLIAYFSGILHYFSFAKLQMHRHTIVAFVTEHWVVSPLLFIFLYIIVAALSLPVGVFLSLLGGFLFTQPFSTLYIVIGATIGASFIFLAAKTALADLLKQKASKFLPKIEAGFRENGVSYLLFLRLVPLFPFWLVNLAPAFLGVRLRTFVWTTFVGIIPGAFVFAQAGAGLGAILDANQGFSIDGIFNWQVKIALIALGIFALIPIVVKKMRKNAR
jgi:uncharacterized membrane protein YdjX (TVP38/TMEM64 family)